MAITFKDSPDQALEILRSDLIQLQVAASRNFRQSWDLESAQIEVARGLPVYRLDIWEDIQAFEDAPESGWSYLLLNEGRPFAFADLERDEAGAWTLRRLRRGPSLAGFISGLKEVQEIASSEDASFVLGIIEIPRASIRLFWLRGPVNLFVPIRPSFLEVRFERILDEEKLKRALVALRRQLSEIDDEPGPEEFSGLHSFAED